MIRSAMVAALLLLAGSASAALMNPSMGAGAQGIGPLVLNDGQWTFGQLSLDPDNDWWVSPSSPSTFLIREVWGTAAAVPGSMVNFEMGADMPDGRATFPIGISKDIQNASSFFWTAFTVDLVPGPGATISNVAAVANAEFGSVVVIDNLDGSFTIEFDQNGGTGVAIGNNTDINFSFDIDGAIDFEIIQVAIPAPGAFALMGMAGLVAIRRRR